MVDAQDLRHWAALLATHRLGPEEAVDVAEQLVDIDDDEATLVLASLPSDDLDRALGLLRRTIERLGVQVPDPEEGAFQLGLDEVAAIAKGERDPLQGALWIWREIWSDWHFPEFSPFVALVDDLDEASTSDRLVIAASIVARAKGMAGLQTAVTC